MRTSPEVGSKNANQNIQKGALAASAPTENDKRFSSGKTLKTDSV